MLSLAAHRTLKAAHTAGAALIFGFNKLLVSYAFKIFDFNKTVSLAEHTSLFKKIKDKKIKR